MHLSTFSALRRDLEQLLHDSSKFREELLVPCIGQVWRLNNLCKGTMTKGGSGQDVPGPILRHWQSSSLLPVHSCRTVLPYVVYYYISKRFSPLSLSNWVLENHLLLLKWKMSSSSFSYARSWHLTLGIWNQRSPAIALHLGNRELFSYSIGNFFLFCLYIVSLPPPQWPVHSTVPSRRNSNIYHL